ncbi:OmpA family protein, partial [Pseudomonas aeruginosa]|nr:OmpA family protein [Pseudomonas aeruginosa]
ANNSAANRARNRRVTVHLSREAVVEPAAEAPKAEDKPAPPAAEPAAPKPPAASLQGKPTV